MDSSLSLTDATGKEIAFNDDFRDDAQPLITHHADSLLTAVMSGKGPYCLHLSDAQRNGGKDFIYRLYIRPPRPDFELRVVPSCIIARPGASGSGLTLKEVISGITRTSSSSANREFISGLQVAIYELNAGSFMLNTLSIMPNLDQHPAAERLLRNMLNHAAHDVNKPLAELPADFDTQLRVMGYRE